jgi:FtsP/CotA-like multicopper oxidase with cupredoxin domain
MAEQSSMVARHAPGNRRKRMKKIINLTIGCAFTLLAGVSAASAFVQYPYDIDNEPRCWDPAIPLAQLNPLCGGLHSRGPEDVDWNNDGIYDTAPLSSIPLAFGTYVTTPRPAAKYTHLGAGDGFSKMADGSDMYIFSFSDLTNVPATPFPPLNIDTMSEGSFKANMSAPTLDITEGQKFFLTLTNVGMVLRPDLFDPHTVHFHGYPNAASVFDGEPMASFGIRMMQDLTYYYEPYGPVFQVFTGTAPVVPSGCIDPGSAGTYMYHCHVEATEHMEMGMLGNNVIRPAQDGSSVTNVSDGRIYSRFAYNDCLSSTDPLCGSTGYDVEKLVQFTAFDPVFHQADLDAQPPPFAIIAAKYFAFNGRGYPDTLSVTPILNQNDPPYPAQKIDSIITASSGQTILLRLSNLAIKEFATIEAPGLTFNVIGMCARQLRNPGPDGIYGTADDQDLSYNANSVMVGPGETYDVIIRTTGVPAGTYHLFSRNLDQLNNNRIDRGGAMTEIRIN